MNAYAEVLARAAEAEQLAKEGAPVVHCEACAADTVARPDGTCVWCDRPL